MAEKKPENKGSAPRAGSAIRAKAFELAGRMNLILGDEDKSVRMEVMRILCSTCEGQFVTNNQRDVQEAKRLAYTRPKQTMQSAVAGSGKSQKQSIQKAAWKSNPRWLTHCATEGSLTAVLKTFDRDNHEPEAEKAREDLAKHHAIGIELKKELRGH